MILDLFRKDNEFYNIRGYDDIMDIVRRALDAEGFSSCGASTLSYSASDISTYTKEQFLDIGVKVCPKLKGKNYAPTRRQV